MLVLLLWTSLHFTFNTLQSRRATKLVPFWFSHSDWSNSMRSPSGFYRPYPGSKDVYRARGHKQTYDPQTSAYQWPGYSNPWVDSNRLLWLHERAESIRTERLRASRYLASICKHSIKASAREERKWIFAHIYCSFALPWFKTLRCLAYACAYVSLCLC